MLLAQALFGTYSSQLMKEVTLCTQDSLESTSHLLCDWLREHILSSDLTLSLDSH